MKLLNFNRPIQRWISFLALFLGAMLLLLWSRFATLLPAVTTPQQLEIAQTEPIQAIPQQIEVARPKVTLGEKLFQVSRSKFLDRHAPKIGIS